MAAGISSGNLYFEIRAGIDALRKDIADAKSQFSGLAKDVEKDGIRIENSWKNVAKGIAAVAGINLGIQGIRSFTNEVIRMTGTMQGLQLSFETMLQSKSAADQMMMDVKNFALATPYTITETAATVKQLIAMNAAGDNVIETYKALGDVAAGLNVPLQRIAVNFGQVAALGKLQAREVRDFAMAGVPIWDELANVMGKSVNEIQALVTAGKVGFKDVLDAFKNMSGEGGRFANMMEKMNSTVLGQVNRLKDQIEQMFATIGEGNTGIIYGAIGGVATLVEHYELIGKTLLGLIATYGAYRTAVWLLIPVQNGLTAAQLTATKAMAALRATLLANPYIAATVAIGAIATAIWAVSSAATAAERAQKRLNDIQDEFTKKQSEQRNKINQLISVIQDQDETITAQIAAYDELIDLSPRLAAAYSREELAVLKLAEANKILNEERDSGYYNNLVTQAYNARTELERLNNELVKETSIGGLATSQNPARENLLRGQIDEQRELLKKLTNDINKFNANRKQGDEEQIIDITKLSDIISGIQAKTIEINNLRSKSSWSKDEIERISELTKEVNDLKKEYQTVTGKSFDKSIESRDSKVLKDNEQLYRLLLSNENDYQQALINLMSEGADKEIAQIRENNRKRLAEILKAEQDLIAAQGSELTFEQMGQFQVQRAASNNQMDVEIDAVLKKEVDLFKDFEKEAIKLYEDFYKKRDESIRKGTITESSSGDFLALAQFKEQMRQLAVEFANANPQFKLWAESLDKDIEGILADGSEKVLQEAIKQITTAINFLKTEIEAIELDGLDTNEAEKYGDLLARLAKLQEELDSLQGKTAKNTERDWRKTYSTLQKIGNEFEQIGKEIGGVTGESIALFGNIATGAIQAVSGIDSLITGLNAAGVAMKALDYASVILGVISSLATVIGSIFGNNRQKEAARQAELLRQQKGYWESINYEINLHLELLDKLSGAAYYDNLTQSVNLLNDAITKQVNIIGNYKDVVGRTWIDIKQGTKYINNDVRDAFNLFEQTGSTAALEALKLNEEIWKALPVEIQDAINAIIEYQAQLDSLIGDAEQRLLQTNKKELGDPFREWLRSGKAATDELGNYFAETMRNALVEDAMMKAIQPAVDAFYEAYRAAADSNGDGQLDLTQKEIDDLRGIWEGIIGLAKTEANAIDSITGNLAQVDSRTSVSQGIAQASQESIDGLTGLIVNIENNTYKIHEISRASNIVLNNIFNQVMGIKMNTDRLEAIQTYLSFGSRTLQNIESGITQLNR